MVAEGTRKDGRDEKRWGWMRLDGSAIWRLGPSPRLLAGQGFMREWAASGSNGSQTAAIAGVFEDFWAGDEGGSRRERGAQRGGATTKRFYKRERSKRRLGKALPKMRSSWKLHLGGRGEGNHSSFFLSELGACVRENPFCDDKGIRCGAASAATAASRRMAPGDWQIRPHAQELITFPRGGKTDWGKKCRFLKIYFGHRLTQIDTDWKKGGRR